jgi:hypothetical protein
MPAWGMVGSCPPFWKSRLTLGAAFMLLLGYKT